MRAGTPRAQKLRRTGSLQKRSHLRGRLHSKTQIEPIGSETLNDKTPPKESRANSPDSLKTISRESPIPRRVFFAARPERLSSDAPTSVAGESCANIRVNTTPRAA